MKAVFFCGNKSPYGIAHLIPLLESRFEIAKVIIANPERWEIFRHALQGKNYFKIKEKSNSTIKALAKLVLPIRMINHLKSRGKNQKNIWSICSQYSVPLIELFDINDKNFCDKLKPGQYDLFFSAAYPQIFSRDLLKLPMKGAVNFHPSALPRCRGAHPHYWALAQGEEYGGVTAHFMTEELDSGDIIAQIKFPILKYNYSQLYKKIINETQNLVSIIEDFFLRKNKKAIPQNSKEATYYRNDREIHRRIFWNIHDADKIQNLYRAGWPFFFFKGEKAFLLKMYVTRTNRNMTNQVMVENGTVVDFSKDSLVIKTLNSFVNIQEMYYCGEKLSYEKWAEKYRIQIGVKME